MKIKKQKLLNFLLHAPEEIDMQELLKFLAIQLKKDSPEGAIKHWNKMIRDLTLNAEIPHD